MSLIYCEISLQLKWSKNCILVGSTAVKQTPWFKISDTKLYVPVETLSTQDNNIKSGFKWTINWNKYQSNKTNQARNRYLGFLINLSFRGVNRLFVLSFENEED